MNLETATQFADAVEHSLVWGGVPAYEAGMSKTIEVLRWLSAGMETIQTRQRLIEILQQMPEQNPTESRVMLAALNMLPQLLGQGLISAGKTIAKENPHKKGPKLKLTIEDQRLVCKHIGELLGRGVPLKVCKSRASQEFGVSLRTIERAWFARRELAPADPEITFEAVMTWAARFFTPIQPSPPAIERQED